MAPKKVVEEAEVCQLELNQNNMETEEGSEGINVTELSVTQTNVLGKVLHSDLLGNPRTENELVDIVRAKDPSIMLLTETWADETRIKDVLRRIKFENMFIALRMNRGGGLVLFWRSTIDVTVTGFSKNYIDAIINKNKENEWRFTRFYGEPETQKRFELWDLLNVGTFFALMGQGPFYYTQAYRLMGQGVGTSLLSQWDYTTNWVSQWT
ncbi:hypothetical protein SO802_015123 [Lithocarpus litseifolius]|uniref:Endonuclease/exonuclease/phosphatase domain-containing protein n=1 Tax=Lithocarpus litseifolius TaxID=425828 RepID=A0AAW2CST9_9ROSI